MGLNRRAERAENWTVMERRPKSAGAGGPTTGNTASGRPAGAPRAGRPAGPRLLAALLACAVLAGSASRAAAVSVTYREGISGYSGCQDVEIQELNGDTNFGSAATIFDGPTSAIRAASVVRTHDGSAIAPGLDVDQC